VQHVKHSWMYISCQTEAGTNIHTNVYATDSTTSWSSSLDNEFLSATRGRERFALTILKLMLLNITRTAEYEYRVTHTTRKTMRTAQKRL